MHKAGRWFFAVAVAASTWMPFAEATQYTLIAYGGSGYRVLPVKYDSVEAFASSDFDYSHFSATKMPVGIPLYCPLNQGTIPPAQYWPGLTDLLVVREIILYPGVDHLQIGIAVDDGAQVFFNDVDISGGMQMANGCASFDRFLFSVPDHLLRFAPLVNSLKIRARDLSGTNYLNVKVTANVW